MKVIRKPDSLEAFEWTGSLESLKDIKRLVSNSDSDEEVYIRGDKLVVRDSFFGDEKIVCVDEVVVLEDGFIQTYDKKVFDYIFEEIGND